MANAVYFNVLLFYTTIALTYCYAPGYSFSKFSGPVSGPEMEITVEGDHHHGPTVDYVAKPDYHFAYGVEDPETHVSQSRHETRDGDAVHGEYSVLDPDGTLRTVKYTADDDHGFQAQVLLNGKPWGHESPPIHQHYPTTSSGSGSGGQQDNGDGQQEDDGGGQSPTDGDDSGEEEEENDEDYYR